MKEELTTLDKLDKNKDGKFSFEEFSELMRSKAILQKLILKIAGNCGGKLEIKKGYGEIVDKFKNAFEVNIFQKNLFTWEPSKK